jgi:hypothetical protein
MVYAVPAAGRCLAARMSRGHSARKYAAASSTVAHRNAQCVSNSRTACRHACSCSAPTSLSAWPARPRTNRERSRRKAASFLRRSRIACPRSPAGRATALTGSAGAAAMLVAAPLSAPPRGLASMSAALQARHDRKSKLEDLQIRMPCPRNSAGSPCESGWNGVGCVGWNGVGCDRIPVEENQDGN